MIASTRAALTASGAADERNRPQLIMATCPPAARLLPPPRCRPHVLSNVTQVPNMFVWRRHSYQNIIFNIADYIYAAL